MASDLTFVILVRARRKNARNAHKIKLKLTHRQYKLIKSILYNQILDYQDVLVYNGVDSDALI